MRGEFARDAFRSKTLQVCVVFPLVSMAGEARRIECSSYLAFLVACAALFPNVCGLDCSGENSADCLPASLDRITRMPTKEIAMTL